VENRILGGSRRFTVASRTLLSLSVIVACSSGTGSSSETEIGESSQAVTAVAVPAAFNMKFDIPTGVALSDVSVIGSQWVRAADRVQVPGVLSSIDGSVTVMNDARVSTITSHSSVSLGDRTKVNGSVRAGTTLTKGNQVTISGTVTTNSPPIPRSVQWTVAATAAAFGGVALEPDQVRTLEPGTYLDWNFKSRAKVTLKTGVYVVKNLTIEPQAQLIIDDSAGPVQLYVQGSIIFRGSVISKLQRPPELLVGVTGASAVLLDAPFNGVLVAPNSPVSLQAALPQGHRAVVIGKNVNLEPDTVLRGVSFDWVGVVGGTVDPQPDASVPTQRWPESPLTGLTGEVPKEGPGSGQPVTDTLNPGKNVSFKLKDKFPVAGGIIGNGTVIFTYTTPSGSTVSCTYKGGSSTNAPATEIELINGRYLTLVSCSDGSQAGTPRIGTTFTMTVNPIPGFPVEVTAPITDDYSCSEELEMLTGQETQQMHTSFNWATKQKVPSKTADGRPTLYYAWVYIQSKAEALSLKKLAIHVLQRPLFNDELDRYAGHCGTFTNPGDGTGTFVPVLIPGDTYNKLIDVRTSDQVSGNRVIFDAVILRDVPVAARTAVGSVKLDVLAQSKFRYLSYEANPFAPDIQLDGGASKALTDALEWVGTAARNVGEAITNTLAELDKLLRGEVRVTLHAQSVTHDPAFSKTSLNVMQRGWGSAAGNKLSANDMQLTILQKLFDSPIPTTSQGWTDFNGRAVIHAVEDGAARGSGLCVELKTPSAIVTDFLIATEICDLRGFDPNATISANATPDDLRLRDFSTNFERQLAIDNVRVMGLIEADDSYQWSSKVAGFSPRRARILSGYWARTFAPDGGTRLFAPCLNYPNSLSDTLAAAASAAGLLVAGPAGALAAGVFASVVGNSDIVMSTSSKLRENREVMSHEYGHFIFCSMLQARNPVAVDNIIWTTVFAGKDRRVPTRYMNEAFADYITGQVAGAADYNWLPGYTDEYCRPGQQPCWDANLNVVETEEKGNRSIGRAATLVHDAFDGQGARFGAVPGDGDVWNNSLGSLTVSSTGYGNTDSALERVALPASSLKTFVGYLADGLAPLSLGDSIDDNKIYGALNSTMKDAQVSWCDRCRVLALHEPGASPTTVKGLFETCRAGGLSGTAVGPAPDADLRLDANTCMPCGPGMISDDNGACQACLGTVVGNTCLQCAADLVIDAATAPFGHQTVPTTTSAAGDNCPTVFWVEIRNGSQAFTRGADVLSAGLDGNKAACDRPLSLELAGPVTGGFGTISTLTVPTGWQETNPCPTGQLCLNGCFKAPSFGFNSASQLPGETFRFGTPSVSGLTMSVGFNTISVPK
jgi:hypothetical protein